MKAAVIVTWSHPKLGREAMALQLGRDVGEYWQKQATGGRCTEPKSYLSRRNPQIWFVEGEYDTLVELSENEQARNLEMKAGFLLDDFSLEVRPLAEPEMLDRVHGVLSELGIA